VNMTGIDGFNWPTGELTKQKPEVGRLARCPALHDGWRSEKQKIKDGNKPFWHPAQT